MQPQFQVKLMVLFHNGNTHTHTHLDPKSSRIYNLAIKDMTDHVNPQRSHASIGDPCGKHCCLGLAVSPLLQFKSFPTEEAVK